MLLYVLSSLFILLLHEIPLAPLFSFLDPQRGHLALLILDFSLVRPSGYRNPYILHSPCTRPVF